MIEAQEVWEIEEITDCALYCLEILDILIDYDFEFRIQLYFYNLAEEIKKKQVEGQIKPREEENLNLIEYLRNSFDEKATFSKDYEDIKILF